MLSYEGRLNHRLDSEGDRSSSRSNENDKVDTTTTQEPSIPLPPERTFTGDNCDSYRKPGLSSGVLLAIEVAGVACLEKLEARNHPE